MNYVQMGYSGLKLTQITFGSALTIGTEHKDYSYAQDLVDEAWSLGIRSFDTANSYGIAEKLLGNALKKYPHDQYVISTKCALPLGDSPYYRGLSRKHILWAIDRSLEELDLDYVDLYYAHRSDLEVPLEEIIRTYNQLIDQGKIRYWATSEWSVDLLVKTHEICNKYGYEQPIIEQPIYSYAVDKIHHNGIFDFCKAHRVGLLGYSPLCQGILTGKYRNGIPADSRIAKEKSLHYEKTHCFIEQYKNRLEHFFSISDQYQIDPTTLALRWIIRNGVCPILGASKVGQLSSSLQFLDQQIDESVFQALNQG